MLIIINQGSHRVVNNHPELQDNKMFLILCYDGIYEALKKLVTSGTDQSISLY
jgi:hypothetical protein